MMETHSSTASHLLYGHLLAMYVCFGKNKNYCIIQLSWPWDSSSGQIIYEMEVGTETPLRKVKVFY